MDPTEMTSHLMTRNIHHFGQSSKSPFATVPLRLLFGYCGTNKASQDLIFEKQLPVMNNTTTESVHPGALQILQTLADGNHLAQFSDVITFDEFWRGFHVWDEQTSTSPSGRHLGHYKSLLMSDGVDDTYNEDNPNPSLCIRRVYYYIAMAALKSANTLQRWCRSSTMMLEKLPNQPKIHKLRVIHLYEADYNLLLKILWARKLVRHSHCHRRLHDAQAGSRPEHRCSDVLVRKEMNYQYAKLTRTSLATVDNDAKACYDRILCNLAMLTSQYFGMSNRACRMHSKTLKNMRFTIRTAGGDSSESYVHSNEQPIHGSGQGSCASPSLWLHISSLLLQILDDIAQGMTRHDVIQNHCSRISAEGFVDDIALFLNHAMIKTDDLNQLYEFIHNDINKWQMLLASSGGKLELTKCFYYILSWKFNKFGDPIPKTLDELREECDGHVAIEDPDSRTSVRLEHKEVTDVHKTLGVLKNISGNDEDQKQALLAKSMDLALKTKLGQLSRFQARRAYTSVYMPSMTYSLVSTSLSETDLYEIQSKALAAYLPAMGYEKTFPRAVVHGPRDFGGANLGHLYTEMCVAKIETLISHLQTNTGLGQIMLTNINWLQLHSGQSTPIFQFGTPLLYLEQNWFLHMREFLYSINGSITIQDQWLPKLERQGDLILMDVIGHHDAMTAADRRIFNNWRLFFQVSNLSDITEPDGTKVQNHYWLYNRPHPDPPKRNSRHNWPNQNQPDLSTFKIWKRGIQLLTPMRQSGELLKPLGDWIVSHSESNNDWKTYIDPPTKFLYQRQQDQTYWCYNPEHNGNGRSTYPVTPEEIIHQLPLTCIPSDMIYHTNSTGLVNHRNFSGTVLRPSVRKVVDFDDHLLTLPRWRSDLIIHWNTAPLDRLLTLFNNDLTLWVATDGSHHPDSDYGSFGVAIGGLHDPIMQVRGHAPGTSGLKSSFRSEMYGILAACVLINEVTKYCQFTNVQDHTLQFYVDSTSVLNRIQSHRQRQLQLGEVLSADMDVECQILVELKSLENMGYVIPAIRHVKSHQDRTTDYQVLSRDAQLNIDADELAASMAQNEYHNISYSKFPSLKAQLYINDEPITSKYKERLRTAFLSQDLREYYIKKFRWENDTLDEIDWLAFGKAIQQLSHADRQRVQKFNVRRLHTMDREHYFNAHISNTCQFCPHIIEDNNHFLQCQCCTIERQTAKEQWNLNMFDFLSQSHTPTSVCTAILMSTNSWLNDQPIPSINEIVPDADTALIKAYEHQSVIGWDNMFRGKLSVYWTDAIRQHLSKWQISSKHMTPSRWSTLLVLELWKGVLLMWDARNKEYFGHDNASRINKEKSKLLQEAQYLQAQGADFDHFDVIWFQKPLTELQQYSVISLKAWIRNARTIVRLYHKEQKSKLKTTCAPLHGTNMEDSVDGLQSTNQHMSAIVIAGGEGRIPLHLQGETILCGT